MQFYAKFFFISKCAFDIIILRFCKNIFAAYEISVPTPHNQIQFTVSVFCMRRSCPIEQINSNIYDWAQLL